MSMFCFQCQETAKNSGCTIQGVCGKKEEIANLQDELIRQLKILAVQYENRRDLNEAGLVAVQSLFMTITNANFDADKFQQQIDKVKALQSCCCCGSSIPAGVLATENEDIRSLRELLTYGVKGIAAYADARCAWPPESSHAYL